MKLQQAIDRVDEMRPNMMSRELKIAALSELDGVIWREIIAKHYPKPGEEIRHAAMPEYDRDTDPGTMLLVRQPYDNLYLYWLLTKVDEQNMETDKYNNDRTMFNNAYDTWSDYWTRTHMPITHNRELRI